MIKVIIIEAEPLAREILECYISRTPYMTIVQSCQNAFEARDALNNNDIDLLFLNTHLPVLSGIDFLRSLDDPPLVIFTSASKECAVTGFELNALDYLLKPFSFERFLTASEKGRVKISSKQMYSPNHSIETMEHSFEVKADRKFVKINYNEVLYIKGLKDYVIIKQDSGQIISLQTMKILEELLPTSIFKRIHKSYIINLEKITALDRTKVEIKIADNIREIPIGRTYRDDLYGKFLAVNFSSTA
ncbi:MAG: response regulator transcription factor [Saprospiraceae bacterium]|nr:response regulator transcription factor [Saprospiraceae bacterium]